MGDAAERDTWTYDDLLGEPAGGDKVRPHVERDTSTNASSTLPSVCQSLPVLTRASEQRGCRGTHRRGHLSVRDVWSTRRAAPRLSWDIGGTLQRPRQVEQPAP